MELKALNVHFFFLLLLAVGTMVFFIFQPFLTAVIAAAILAALFKNTYHTLERWLRGSRITSALITCLLVIVIIVTPVSLILSLAIGEANSLYNSIGEESALERMIDTALNTVRNAPYLSVFFDAENLNQERILQDVRQLSENALGLLQAAYTGITHFVFWVFVMFFTLFYFLIDGKKALKYFMQLSPLRNEHEKILIERFISISRATLKGTIVIGIIQGVIGGLTFWVAGVPSPAIWGLIMVLFSVIPLVGPAIVWLPVGIIMLLLGDVWQGVFILAIGTGIISVIDNILRPKLVGRDTQLHPLLIFFATIGGISFFGLSGFIIGPIIIALFTALSEIYSIEFRDQLKEYNQ